MRTSIFFFPSVLLCFMSHAQDQNRYENLTNKILKKEKVLLVKETLKLSNEEAVLFWPLYEEYNQQLIEIEIQHLELVERYRESFQYLNDELADDFWTSKLENINQYNSITNEYYQKFKEVLPAHRVAQYFQLEYKIRLLVHAELTEEIPLIAVAK